ncbi:MAG: phosphatase PAP2 family protein [Bacteroidaceae bacterium]|nr:phosphatase PAP2 family protein [Bacteroidaceae bacterium]
MEIMLERLKDIDNSLFVALNGSDSVYWDAVMWLITKTTTWIPLLLILVYVIARNSDLRRFALIVTAMLLTVALADRLSSGLIKPLVMRWRPTHDATFLHTLDTVWGYTGGRYGFVSSHAANTFALFAFLSLVLRSRLLSFFLLLWACVSSYSRVYLGVHFPGDILCGAILGLIVGLLVYLVYNSINRRMAGERQFYSTAYTSSGFLYADVHLLVFTLLFTYLVVLLLAIPLAL